MKKCPIQRKIADSRRVKFTSPAHLACFLGCSQRTARDYCKSGLIPEASTTSGGHWRIRLPLSAGTKWKIAKLKNPKFWKAKVGQPTGDFDADLVEELMLAAIPDVDEATWERIQRQIAERHQSSRGLDDLLLSGWIMQLEREGLRPTTTALAQRMEMSRDTFHRRYVTTGQLADARMAASRFDARELPTVKNKREIS